MENKEIWKDIKGYEGLYRISSYGNIFYLTRNVLIKPYEYTDNRGRKSLRKTLMNPQKTFIISRLVYSHFIGEIKGMIDFKDGDFRNCKSDNLIDVSQTIKYKNKGGVKIIDTKTMKLYYSYTELAKELNVHLTAVKYGIKNNYKKYSQYKIIK